MKVLVRNHRYVKSSKDLPSGRCSGEFVGICKFSALAGRRLFREAESLLSKGKLMAYDTEAINKIAKEIAIYAIDVAGLPWIEIDTPHDLKNAGKVILPQIQHNRKFTTSKNETEPQRRGLRDERPRNM